MPGVRSDHPFHSGPVPKRELQQAIGAFQVVFRADVRSQAAMAGAKLSFDGNRSSEFTL
jgi:hypothetical protein